VTPICNNPLKRERDFEFVPFRNKKVCLENLAPDTYGFQGALFPNLDIIDLLHFRTLNLTYKHMVELELVNRINRSEITFRDIGLKTVTQILHYFTYHTEKITHLDLKELVVSDSDLELVKDNFPKLQSLHLNKTYVYDTYIFAQMKLLKILELIDCCCTLDFFDMSFVNDCQLEVLILNRITFPSLKFLTPSLIKLEICDCYPDKADFCHLNLCTSLKDLNLTNTSFCDPNFLNELSLERLVLAGCEQIDGPIILKNPESLIELNVSPFERMNLEFIKNFINLKKLTVNHINDLKYLAGCQSLSELDFSSRNFIDLTPLTNLPLTKLTISARCLNFEELSKLTSLTHLDVMGANFDDLDSISELPLETLTIAQCESLAFLRKFTKLTKLIVHETHSSDINHLVHLPLEHLHLGECYEPENYSSFEKIKILKTLIIEKADSIQDLSFLKQLVDLEVLSIAGCRCIGNFEFISYCKKLKDLNLASTHVPFLNFIKNLKFLKTLNIDDTCSIHDIGSLVNCDMLRTLIYANKTEHISDIKTQIEGIHKKYYQSLYENNQPQQNLFQSDLDDLDCVQLAATNEIEEAMDHLDTFREDIRLFQLSQGPKDPDHLDTLGYCYANGIAVDENLSMALLNYYLAAANGNSPVYKEHFDSLLQDVYTLAEEGDSECQNVLQFCREHGIIY